MKVPVKHIVYPHHYCFINDDLTVTVCTDPEGRSGGWSTPAFDAHWKARAWCNAQGYTVVDRNRPTWQELCEA